MGQQGIKAVTEPESYSTHRGDEKHGEVTSQYPLWVWPKRKCQIATEQDYLTKSTKLPEPGWPVEKPSVEWVYSPFFVCRVSVPHSYTAVFVCLFSTSIRSLAHLSGLLDGWSKLLQILTFSSYPAPALKCQSTCPESCRLPREEGSSLAQSPNGTDQRFLAPKVFDA